MKRNFGLDLLRAFSIWLVLAQHGGINIPGLSPLKIGGIGVEVFFVLSGFLIGGILFKDIDDDLSIKKTLLRFWTRRWFRILPLYYSVLLFKFIVLDHSIGSNIFYYFLFLQNNFYGINFLDVSWSLVIEEWFYLFVPVFLLLSNKLFKSDKKIFIALIAFIIAVNIARLVYVIAGNVPYAGVNSNFPFRFDSLFLGVFLAFIKHKKWKLFETLKSPVIFLTGFVLFFSYLYFYWIMAYPVNSIDKLLLPRTAGFFILPFTIALMVPYISSIGLDFQKNYFQKIIFKVITTTSVLTYAIYLIHPFVFPLVFGSDHVTSIALRWLMALSLTYLFAWLIYTFFEKPILLYRDKITRQNKSLQGENSEISLGRVPINEQNNKY